MNLFKKIFAKKELSEISDFVDKRESEKTITVNGETHQGEEMIVISDKTLVDGKEVESNIHKDNNIDSTSSIRIK